MSKIDVHVNEELFKGLGFNEEEVKEYMEYMRELVKIKGGRG